MNTAHLHLILVHVPIVLVPLGIVIFVISLWKMNDTLRNTALNIFVASSIFAITAYLLGEGAEEAVEHIVGIEESAIEKHEDAGTFAVWATGILGALSLSLLISLKFSQRKIQYYLAYIILFAALLSSGALTYTAQQGGKIRHPEAYL